MTEPLTIKVAPELAELLRRPGGYRSRGPVTFWLDGDVINVRELTEAELLSDVLWAAECEEFGCHDATDPDHSSRSAREEGP